MTKEIASLVVECTLKFFIAVFQLKTMLLTNFFKLNNFDLEEHCMAKTSSLNETLNRDRMPFFFFVYCGRLKKKVLRKGDRFCL